MLVEKNLPANTGNPRDTGSILGSGRSPGGGNGNPLQYSCLENPMDRGAWRAKVHRVTKSQTRLSNWARLSQMKLARALCSCLAPLLVPWLCWCKKGLSTLPCLMSLFCSLWGYLCKKYVISKAWVEICVTLHGRGHISSGGKVTVEKSRGLCWVLD